MYMYLWSTHFSKHQGSVPVIRAANCIAANGGTENSNGSENDNHQFGHIQDKPQLYDVWEPLPGLLFVVNPSAQTERENHAFHNECQEENQVE